MQCSALVHVEFWGCWGLRKGKGKQASKQASKLTIRIQAQKPWFLLLVRVEVDEADGEGEAVGFFQLLEVDVGFAAVGG